MAYTVKNLEIQSVLLNPPAIFSNRGLPVKITYWLSRLQKELRRLAKDMDDERIKIVEAACLRGEDNKPTMVNNVYQFENDVIQGDVIGKTRELLNLDVEVGLNQIDINLNDPQFHGAISAEEIIRLEPFVNFIEPKEEPQNRA